MSLIAKQLNWQYRYWRSPRCPRRSHMIFGMQLEFKEVQKRAPNSQSQVATHFSCRKHQNLDKEILEELQLSELSFQYILNNLNRILEEKVMIKILTIVELPLRSSDVVVQGAMTFNFQANFEFIFILNTTHYKCTLYGRPKEC